MTEETNLDSTESTEAADGQQAAAGAEPTGAPDKDATTRLRELEEQLQKARKQNVDMAASLARATYDDDARKQFQEDASLQQYAEQLGLPTSPRRPSRPVRPDEDGEDVDPAIAMVDDRIGRIERQMKQLTGLLERQSYQTQFEQLKAEQAHIPADVRDKIVNIGIMLTRNGMASDAREGIRQVWDLAQRAAGARAPQQPGAPSGPSAAPPETLPPGQAGTPPPRKPTNLTTVQGRREAEARGMEALARAQAGQI